MKTLSLSLSPLVPSSFLTFHASVPSPSADPTAVEVMTVAPADNLTAFLAATAAQWDAIVGGRCAGGDAVVHGSAAAAAMAAVEAVFADGRDGFSAAARATNVGYVLHPEAYKAFEKA